VLELLAVGAPLEVELLERDELAAPSHWSAVSSSSAARTGGDGSWTFLIRFTAKWCARN
jgi:hypothetical protein